MEKVLELVQEIKDSLTQVASSNKDEIRVMKAMLNDKEYVVDVYEKEGKIGEYCPSRDAREMMSSVLCSTTKITQEESKELMDSHEFNKKEATSMINVSKEFFNTYFNTGRKIGLGGRELSNVSLSQKVVKATDRPYPVKVGVDEAGKGIYQRGTAPVEKHLSVRVHAPCPEWVGESEPQE